MASPDNNIDKLDAVRTTLLSAARESGESLASLSASLGKNPAYLQQFVRRGSPRKLPEDIRFGLARLLSIDESELGGFGRTGTNEVPEDFAEPLSAGHRQGLRGFAVRLAAARQKAGFYSQSRFALGADIPLSRYVILEQGDDDPTIAELDAISATSGVSLNWLIKG